MNTPNSSYYYAFPQADLTNPDLEILSACPKQNKAPLDWRWTPSQWAGVARTYCLSAHEAAHMYLAKWTLAEVEQFVDWISDNWGANMDDHGVYINEYDEVFLRSTTYEDREAWMKSLAPSAKAYKYI